MKKAAQSCTSSLIPSSDPLSKSSLINLDYNGHHVFFNEEGWLDATSIAILYGKRPVDWLALDSTQEYLTTLCDIVKCEKSSLLKTRHGRHGGGTWFHPKLAVPFARWLDVRFAIWCDFQIENLLKKSHPHFDWKRIRHEASSSYKVMGAVLQLVRQNQGKPTQHFHYANEAKLVNWAMTGEYKPLTRDILSVAELDLLAKLEERNAVLVGCGLGREERKMALTQFVSDFKIPSMIKGGVA